MHQQYNFFEEQRVINIHKKRTKKKDTKNFKKTTNEYPKIKKTTTKLKETKEMKD